MLRTRRAVPETDHERGFDAYTTRVDKRWGKKWSQFFKNKLVVSISYLISIAMVYQYFHLKSQNLQKMQSSNQMVVNPLYVIPETMKRIPEPTEVFERYRYKADAILLPNAPYKHIKRTLDIRASQLIYLDAVRQQLEKTRQTADNTPPMFDFHWADWVDMSDLEPLIIEKPNCFVAGVLGSSVRTEWYDCIDLDGKELNGLNFYFDRLATQFESEYRLLLRAKTYLNSVAPIPKKMIFITGELAFVVKTKNKVGVLQNGMVQNFIESRLKDHKDIMLTEDHIREQPISANAVFDLISQELGRDLRDFNTLASKYADVSADDFNTLVKKIRKSKLASQAARAGLNYFHDVLVQGEHDNFVAPYDWRFFQKTLDQQRHRAALHQTIRAWLSLNANLGLNSWLDEDSLVGWSFNGMVLPWQKTVKFKMPAKDILKLGTYNHSLVVDDPLEGHGTYLLDLSPYFMERARKNDPMKSPDAVDARFIDTKTGVYLELNGLMISDATIPEILKKEFSTSSLMEFVNSGDGKFYHLSDLLPIKKTLFEGKVANVPGNALKLVSQYNHDIVSSKEHENFRYQDHLRLWISKSKCNYVPQEDITIYENGGSSFIGACHDLNIWGEFNATSAVSEFRKLETQVSVQLEIGNRNQFEPFYPDYWLLDRIEKLNKEYGYPLP